MRAAGPDDAADVPTHVPDVAADVPPGLDVEALVDRIEDLLLGGQARYTRAGVVERSEVAEDEVRRLWRALGFASTADDEVAFTDNDIAALATVRRLASIAPLDDDQLHAMARMLGQSFSRLASWQGQLVIEMLAGRPDLLASGDRVVGLLDELTDAMQDVQNYVWRRQLAAYLSRVASNASEDGLGAETNQAVGFADLRNFTTLSRTWTEAELRSVLESFEALANEIVAAHRGRIVKTIGDEVLFVADRPADAAGIALDLLDAAAAKDDLPELRIGIAAGPVVQRFGDVYGTTVNIASRLTGIARPGSALVDRGLADAIADDPRFALRSKRPESVRGYHHLHSWRLRRGDDEHRADER